MDRSLQIIEAADLVPRQQYRMMTSLVLPRPIAWISSRSEAGVPNLAPFSYYVALAADPAMVGVSIGTRRGAVKDTLANLRATRDFCISVVTERHLEAMNHSAGDFPADRDEFVECGVAAAEATLVDAPYVADAPAVLECRFEREVDLSPSTTAFVIARVLAFHVPEGTDPEQGADLGGEVLVSRLGGEDYGLVRERLTLPRPVV